MNVLYYHKILKGTTFFQISKLLIQEQNINNITKNNIIIFSILYIKHVNIQVHFFMY